MDQSKQLSAVHLFTVTHLQVGCGPAQSTFSSELCLFMVFVDVVAQHDDRTAHGVAAEHGSHASRRDLRWQLPHFRWRTRRARQRT